MNHKLLLTLVSLTYVFVVISHPMQEQPDYKGGSSSGFKTICYFTNWGAHRNIEDGRLFPEDIPADLCTHILYAFGVISGTSIRHTIQNDIEDYQGQKPLYGRIMKLKEKNPNLKILISCGGWGANGQFEGIVGSNESRTTFSNNVIQFCRKWGFDGIDLDWEFPGADHKTKFGLLAETMFNVFSEESQKSGKPRLLTSIATAAGQYLLKQGYDIPVLCKYLDMVSVMTYDLYGNWYNKIGHHSALYGVPEEKGQDAELNTNQSMYNWITRGCAREKLNIGVPTYGRAFSAPGSDPLKAWGQSGGGSGGISSTYMGEAGIQTYFEVCMKLNSSGFKRYWHPKHMSPIAFSKDGTWIGYDDAESVIEKCKYVKKEKLGGAMSWTLDMDDFKGKFCKKGPFPVISALSACLKEPIPTTTIPTTTTTEIITPSTTQLETSFLYINSKGFQIKLDFYICSFFILYNFAVFK